MMRHIVSIPLLLLLFAINVKSDTSNSGCSMKDVMTCVVQLKSYNVPIDTNMMNVVFNVSTEAKLVHVCRAYNNAMPCFKQRLATCANEKQRIRLEEVNRLLLFICAPFSLQRQKTLLKVGKCIGEVLNHPVEPNCSSTKHRFWHKLRLCRDNCESNDVVCQMRVRMSELAVCSVIAIEKQCGRQAADFYSYMQTAIIAEEFPIQCKYDYAADKIRKLLNSQEFLNEEVFKNIQPPSQQFIVQELVLPKSETTTSAKKSKESSQISSSSTSNENNGSLIKGTRISSSSSFNYTKKALKIFQNDRKKVTAINNNNNNSNKTSEENDSQAEEENEEEQQKQQQKKEKTKAIRTRNFSKLFRPSKFAEINLKKYQPPENTVIVQLFPTKESLENMTSKEKSSNEQQLPAFLQGARPIPDSSSMGRSIILPKTTYLFSKEIPSKEFLKTSSKSKELKSNEVGEALKLAGVREIYNPKIDSKPETSTLTFLFTTTEEAAATSTISSSTTTTTTTSPAPPTTTTTTPAPIIITFTEIIPVQTTPPPPSTTQFTAVIDDTTQNKFYPWYYNSLSKQNNTSMVTTNPIFPYFNPKTLSSLPKPPTIIDPYYSNNNQQQQQQQINNFDPNAFAANFVSRINLKGFLTTTTTPSTSDDIAKLLNMPDFKEKADTILSTAIDVLKPHNKYQQPFADVPNDGLHHSPPMNSNQQNKTASGAFTELMETIKKISPTVLDNIREKLNNLGHN